MNDKTAAVKYVVGLGNPGRRYRDTRHNVGFRVLGVLRRRWDFGRARTKFHARVWSGRIGAAAVTLMAPETYMNESGLSAGEMVRFHKADPSGVLVVLDDLALPVGRLRARAGGSAGGHKGLADVLAALGTDAVPRLRVGIGAPPEGVDATRYVLSVFDDAERTLMSEALARAADAVADWVGEGITSVMDRYNPDGADAARAQRDGRER